MVIAIIGVLAAISSTAVMAALAKARTMACASNLRSIGNGLFAYAADNNGEFPEAGSQIPYDTIDSTTGKNSWTQQLEPYITGKASAVYVCPDSSRVIPSNKTYSYFLGAHAAHVETGGFAPVSLAKMHAASCHILAGDIAYSTFSTTDADKDDYTQDPAFNGNQGNIPIHHGTANILFADGHVANLSSFDKNTMTTRYDGPGFDYLQ